jgi:hypothetical protein
LTPQIEKARHDLAASVDANATAIKATDPARIERRLWAAPNPLRAYPILSPAEYRGPPVLGLTLFALAEHRFARSEQQGSIGITEGTSA